MKARPYFQSFLLCAMVVAGRVDASCSTPVLTQQPLVTLGQATTGLAIGDVDGDGEIDLVTVGGAAENVEVRLGAGDATFGQPLNYPVADARDVVLGDLDGDDALDVIVSIEPGVTAECTAFGSCASFAVLLNDGDGTFGSPAPVVVPFAARIVALDNADFDADGFRDVLVGAPALVADDPQVHVFFGSAAGTFTRRRSWSIEGQVKDAAPGKMNGPDAEPDVMIAAGPSQASTYTRAMVYPSSGGTFPSRSATSNLSPSDEPIQILPVDVNGDGKLDIAFTYYHSTTQAGPMWGAGVTISNGNASLSVPQGLAEAPSAVLTDLAAGDVNEDGYVDLVTAGGGWKAFRRTATSFVIPQGTVPSGSTGVNASRVIASDYDHDGRTDFIFLDTAGAVSILRGECASRYSKVALSTSPNPSTTGQTITASIAVTPLAGAPQPTGFIELMNGTTLLGMSDIDGNGTATILVDGLAANTYTLTARYSGDETFASQTSAAVTHTVALPPFGAPFNVSALGNAAANQVTVRWTATSNAATHDVLRRDNGAWVLIASGITGQSYVDSNVSNAAAYVYAVRSWSTTGETSPLSGSEVATTANLALPGDMLIRATDITTTRTLVNSLRNAAGLSQGTFTDAILSGVKMKAAHITELRTALAEARSTLGLTTLTFTQPAITPSVTPIRRADVMELRNSFM